MNLLGSLRKEKPKFTGSMTALITPFDNGELDLNSFRNIVKHQIDNGTDGLIPVGTTGESPTLSWEEQYQLLETVRNAVNGSAKVLAGTGSNSTSEAIHATAKAAEAGADGAFQRFTMHKKAAAAYPSRVRRPHQGETSGGVDYF